LDKPPSRRRALYAPPARPQRPGREFAGAADAQTSGECGRDAPEAAALAVASGHASKSLSVQFRVSVCVSPGWRRRRGCGRVRRLVRDASPPGGPHLCDEGPVAWPRRGNETSKQLILLPRSATGRQSSGRHQRATRWTACDLGSASTHLRRPRHAAAVGGHIRAAESCLTRADVPALCVSA